MKKTIQIDTTPSELQEILDKDFLEINGQMYVKKDRVKTMCENFVYHLERNGKITIHKTDNNG